MKRRALYLTPLLLVVAAALFWQLRDAATPTSEVPVPMGETVQRVVPDGEGNAEVWTLSKKEIPVEDLELQALPQAAPRESEPGAHTDSARALNARALEAWKHGEIVLAMQLFEAAIEADPEDAVPRSDYGRLLLMMTVYDRALPQLERAAELTPDDPRVWLDLLTYYEKNILLERANYARRKALELSGGQELVLDETGLWRLPGDSIFP